MNKQSEFRLVVSLHLGKDLHFYYDTRAELVVAEMMIQKGLMGRVSGVAFQQWVDENHVRYNGESKYMNITLN
ncbi:hypothetical protein [Peribacillus asahii]|uniref:hypothetical protein n=1 Tax=Peribacillus asahii TaxID=228899 RepID=UPI00381FC462